MASRLARVVVGTVLLVFLTACPEPASVVSVSLLGGDLVLPTGVSRALEVDVHTIGAIDASVSWASSDEGVATVDDGGTLTTHAPGSAAITATSNADATKSGSINVTVNAPGAIRWGRQFGTTSGEHLTAVAADAEGNVYAAGYTGGALEGANSGAADAFIRSYDGDGGLRWTRQFGTSGSDVVFAIATDVEGNVYAAGYTGGALEGANSGAADAFIRSYDGDGGLRWTRQFGTSGSDVVFAIATDVEGNVYAAGYTGGALEGANSGAADAFIRSYDGDGGLRWTRQFGTSGSDVVFAIATDVEGNVYAAGYTGGALEGANSGAADAFIRSYDGDGGLRWTRQFGTSGSDVVFAIATDVEGNVYAAGYTGGALGGANAGAADAFVRSYDGDGGLRWTRQFGTASSDAVLGVATDGGGNVYTAGFTVGALVGENAGSADAFVRSYDGDGGLRWTRQFGTSGAEEAYDVATDAEGNVYAVGYTVGALEGANAGSADAFIRSFWP